MSQEKKAFVEAFLEFVRRAADEARPEHVESVLYAFHRGIRAIKADPAAKAAVTEAVAWLSAACLVIGPQWATLIEAADDLLERWAAAETPNKPAS